MKRADLPSPRYAVILLGVFILFEIAVRVGWFDWLSKSIQRSLGSLLASERGVSISMGDKYRFFSSRDEFLESAASCFNSVGDTNAQNAELARVEAENAELRDLLSFKKQSAIPPVVASVISKSDDSNQQILIIDKGTNDGITAGAPVVVRNGIYVGSVDSVEASSAAVRLMNDNNSKVAISILSKDASIGVLEGGYGISLRIRFIPRNETVSVGDKVITSGLESTVPRGLSIGTVTVVESQPFQPFQEAVVSPLVDLSKLTTVGVLVNQK